MGDKTKIEWTDATWNPVTGCTKVSAGCAHCYAERMFKRPYPGRDFTDVRTHPERLDWPLRWRGSKQARAEGRPSRIFVNSMSDLFHESVSKEFIADVVVTMSRSKHVFQILTKRPHRMLALFGNLKARWGPFDNPIPGDAERYPLPNVWLGVSVEDQATADERIPLLLQTSADVRFVSYEPALRPVDFRKWIPAFAGMTNESHAREGGHPLLDWLIAGGESGPKARPSHPDWFRSARDQCQAAGVPFFFKQWGEWAPIPSEPFKYSKGQWVAKDGISEGGAPDVISQYMVRFGKKLAGRLLDGREWNEFPKSF